MVTVIMVIFLQGKASLVAQVVKNLAAIQETRIQYLGWEDLLKKGMATHSVFLPGESPWTEEPGRLQARRSQRVRQDCVTKHTLLSTFLQGSCP